MQLRPQNSDETALINATNYLLLATGQGFVSFSVPGFQCSLCTEAYAPAFSTSMCYIIA